MNAFIEYINSLVELTSEAQQDIMSITIHKVLPPGTILLHSGTICNEFHFLASGLARVYYLKDGKDVTAWFASEGNIASAIDSLFSSTPSMYNIELLEHSEIYSVQYRKIETVLKKHPIVERVGRILITKNYLLLDERVKLFAFCTAEESYDILLQQLPDIFARVKLGHIASYLGVTQEHLSRIRGNYKSRSKKF